MRRYQGAEWAAIKEKRLIDLDSFTITKDGHISVICRFKGKNKTPLYHFLSPIETEKFIESDFFKNARKRRDPNKLGYYHYAVPNEVNQDLYDLNSKPNRSFIIKANCLDAKAKKIRTLEIIIKRGVNIALLKQLIKKDPTTALSLYNNCVEKEWGKKYRLTKLQFEKILEAVK